MTNLNIIHRIEHLGRGLSLKISIQQSQININKNIIYILHLYILDQTK